MGREQCRIVGYEQLHDDARGHHRSASHEMIREDVHTDWMKKVRHLKVDLMPLSNLSPRLDKDWLGETRGDSTSQNFER